MPAPIVLSTLTPETKKVLNPPAGQPVIATKADLRDGTRTSEPVAPPPPPPPTDTGEIFGLDAGQPHALTKQEWFTRLEATAKNFTTGISDPTFNPRTDITYIGAFRIPFSSGGVSNTRQKQCLGYNPPNGTNGAGGSLFLGGANAIAEISIPTLSMATDPPNLPASSVLQQWASPYVQAPSSDGSTLQWNGWLKVIDGKLYSSWYKYYTTTYKNIYNLVVSEDVTNIATGGTIGAFHMTTDPSQPGQFDEDHVIRYCAEIPAEKRALFNGDTHFAGISADISIVDRSSYGHSVYSFNPASVVSTDTVVPTTKWLRYQNTNAISGYDNQNGDIIDHYSALMGMPAFDYVQLDPATRETSFAAFPLPDEALRKHLGCVENNSGCSFIPPGTNTLVHIGSTYGMRYGVGYRDGYIDNHLGTGGFTAMSMYDKDNVFWTMNLSDIASTTTNQDVAYSDFGIFDNNRWREPWTLQGVGGLDVFYNPAEILGGDFDPVTGRLFVLQTDAYPFGGYEYQHIVSVYQVGSPT